jgi:iron complex transport system ATP-binding protein
MLEIQSLSVGYGDRLVLRDVSLVVNAGEILAVVGPNGAGKSTLIRSVSGVIPLRGGKVLFAGKDLSGLPASQRARLLAVVPQAHQLPEAYSVYDTVLLGRTPYLNWLGQAGQSDHAQVRRVMDQADIISLSSRRVGELSGGEQQRVLLARALAQNAPLLLLDEPTTHLDLQHQSGLLNLVRKLAIEERLAVLMVLHDLNLAGLYANRVALLVNGELQAVGAPQEVLTAEILSAVYHIPVSVISHPDYGSPLVLPDGRFTAPVSRSSGIAK